MVLLRLSRESVHRTAPAGFLLPVSPVNFLDCYRHHEGAATLIDCRTLNKLNVLTCLPVC
jgi:hypothetical protein